MRSLIIALVLSLPVLNASSTQAAIMSGPDFVQSQRNDTVDRAICDKVRYNLGIPKVDKIMANAVMADCMERFSRITDPRPAFSWEESTEEAVAICTAYTKQSRFDPVSEMLLIVETSNFDKCMRSELWE